MDVADLYVGEVLVVSRDDVRLREGARAGLLQVLVRVSGSTAVADNATIRAALRNPAAYYYQYGYGSTDRLLLIDGQEVPAQVLRLSFDSRTIATLLRDAGFPVWGTNRPAVLLWVAEDDDTDRRLLTEAGPLPLREAFAEEAKSRGLPLLFPLLDLEDELSPVEVWGLFLDRIEVASARYGPDVILAGRISKDDQGLLVARWYYHIVDRWQGLDGIVSEPQELIAAVMDQLASELAAQYAVGAARGSLMLRVGAVDDLDDYADVSAYLQSLAPVVDLAVVEVQGDEILFRLETEGQATQLREIISLDRKMLPINARSGDGDQPIRYRWTGGVQ